MNVTLYGLTDRKREAPRAGYGMSRGTCWTVLFLAATTWFGVAAAAITPATLTDTQLRDTSVQLVSIDDGVASLYDANGVLRLRQTEDIVQIAFGAVSKVSNPTESEQDKPAWILTLTDGQRWVGTPAPSLDPTDTETLRWNHNTLGTVAVSLERVQLIERRVTRSETLAPSDTATRRWAEPAEGQPVDDTATLRNGDRLTGFVATLNDQGVTLETENGEVPLTWDNLAAVRLANPVQTKPAVGDVLELRDGSRIRLRAFRLNEEQIEATPALLAETLGIPEQSAVDDEARRSLPLTDAASLSLAASGFRVVDLTTLRPDVEGGSSFGLPFPPKLVTAGPRSDSTSAWVHAPTTLTFDMPAGCDAIRLAGRVTLVLPDRIDPAAEALAQAAFFVADSTGDVFTRPLGPDVAWPFRVPLDGNTIQLRIEPGPNGPTLGRVRLDQLRLLMWLDDR